VRRGALPTFLVVGAQKAGTSSLGLLLDRHPDIGMPRRKELHYFGTERRYRRGLDFYRSRFRQVADRPERFEATPGYLYVPEVAARVARDLPDTVRFVAVLRDPVERAYSHYWHGRRLGAVRVSFEDALAREPEHLAKGDWVWWSLVDRGRYLPQLRRFCAAVGRERVLVLLFEDLVRDPPGVADRVASWIGVEPLGPAWGALPHENRSRRRVLPGAPYFAVLRHLPFRLRVAVNRFTTVPFRPPPMRATTRAELAATFRADNRELAEWLGLDLSRWTR
jgi:hypothetical protein